MIKLSVIIFFLSLYITDYFGRNNWDGIVHIGFSNLTSKSERTR